ncbi:hypothetical protein GCM10023185_18700 [Hymenobacter saemangeumensis]|uniref:Uncharacterized protein n=1 Tax=Hymenobacter saemangeumensis TaxID=1084522 RepID=A0ABP8IBY0_9BACT
MSYCFKPIGANNMDNFNEQAIDLFRIEELEERLEMQTTCSATVNSNGTCSATVSHTFDW